MEEEIEEVNSRSNEVKNKVKSLQEDLLSKQVCHLVFSHFSYMDHTHHGHLKAMNKCSIHPHLQLQETEMELRNEVGRLKGEMGAKDKLMSRQEIDLCDVTDQLQQCRQLLNKV